MILKRWFSYLKKLEVTEPHTAFVLRHVALALALLAALLTPVELVFAKHYAQPTMLIPFALVLLSVVGILGVLLNPSRQTLRLFRWVMGLLFIGSAIGVFFHLRGNLAVARDIDPTLSGLKLLWEVLTGAAPALAPGLLAQVGLLGLAYTYQHPGLDQRKTRPVTNSKVLDYSRGNK